MKDDPEQLYANFHAFNRWLDEEWGFDHDGTHLRRAAPLAPSTSTRAVAELDFVLATRRARGRPAARARPYGRSPADPYFDPFWARLDEARVPVAFHIGESGYNEMFGAVLG